MEITKTLHVTDRREWRKWLRENHQTAREIWLVYYRKGSGKPRIPYDDAVEEALCYGWIDGIAKGIDDEKSAQRFTPRKPNSNWSELNKARVRKLIANGKMTKAGLAKLGAALDDAEFEIPADILKALKADRQTWKNFEQFSDGYKRARVRYVDEVRGRPAEYEKRLANLLKMTAANKKFGALK